MRQEVSEAAHTDKAPNRPAGHAGQRRRDVSCLTEGTVGRTGRVSDAVLCLLHFTLKTGCCGCCGCASGVGCLFYLALKKGWVVVAVVACLLYLAERRGGLMLRLRSWLYRGCGLPFSSSSAPLWQGIACGCGLPSVFRPEESKCNKSRRHTQ